MKWKVGENYKLRNGREVRVLAVDAPKQPFGATQYPIVSMGLESGFLHTHLADGTNPQHDFDLMPRVKHVEGWMGVKGEETSGARFSATTCIYKNKDDVIKLTPILIGLWHIIPVSFDIEEEG